MPLPEPVCRATLPRGARGLALLPLLLGALPGCSRSVDEAGAQAVFEALVLVNADLTAGVEAMEEAEGAEAAGRAAPRGRTAAAKGSADARAGAIEGGLLWTGVIEVEGSSSQSEADGSTTSTYDLAVTYIDVAPFEPEVVLNGDLQTHAELERADDGSSFALSTRLDGDLVVEGEAEGEAEVHTTLAVAWDAETGGFTAAATGDIGGYEVSDFVVELEASAFGE